MTDIVLGYASKPAVYLNGSTDYISVAHHADLTPTTEDFTIVRKIRVKTMPATWCWLVDKSASETAGYELLLYSSGYLRLINRGATTGNQYTAAGVITLNTDYIIHVTKTGTTSEIYVNAIDKGSGTMPAELYSTSTPLYLDVYNGGASGYFNGIDYFTRFYKGKAFTPTEVAADYASPDNPPIQDSTLKLWLPLREGTGATAYDINPLSGATHNGTLAGTSQWIYPSNLTIDYVDSIIPISTQRFAVIDIPSAVGSMIQNIGESPRQISLHGALVQSTRFDNLYEVERVRALGKSIILDCNLMQSCVFLRAVKPKQFPAHIEYDLDLIESRRRILNACDSTADVTVDSGGGTLSADAYNKKEGAASLNLYGAINAATSSRMKWNPSAAQNMSDGDWVSFWFYISSISNLDDCYVKIYTDASNYATFTFTTMVTAAGQWLKMRLNKNQFSIMGTMNWASIDYMTVEVIKTTAETYSFQIDELAVQE